MKLHIMNVPDLPEMFPGEPLRLQTIVNTEAKVSNASRNCLFYRKAIRANKEARTEDFLDLTFILESSNREELDRMISFCSKDNRKVAVSTGIRNLIGKRKDFRGQIESRLAHARPSGSIEQWIEDKGRKLDEFSRELNNNT